MTTRRFRQPRLVGAILPMLGFAFCVPSGPMLAQDSARAGVAASSTRPWREGSVFQVEFMRTHYGATEEYLRHLLFEWGRLLDVAQKRGLILSYKVLLGPPANRDDFDVLTWIEFKDPGAMEGWDDRLRAIEAEIFPRDRPRDRSLARGEIRDVLGMKLMRAITLRQDR